MASVCAWGRGRRRAASSGRRGGRGSPRGAPRRRPARSRRPGRGRACPAGTAASAGRPGPVAGSPAGPPGGQPGHVVVGPGPRRPRPGGRSASVSSTTARMAAASKWRLDEREVEGQVELVGARRRSSEARRLDRSTGVSPSSTRSGRAVGEPPPAPDDLVHLGPVGVVDRALTEHLLRRTGRPRWPAGCRGARRP